MKFYTRFETAAKIKRPLSLEDKVDRLSYVDNTLMVKRLILEGKNLAIYRASALKSGLYSDKDAIVENDGIPFPVYQQDPALIAPLLDNPRLKSDKDEDKAFSKDEDLSDLSKDDSANNGSDAIGPALV